ncbi:hypothetical protein EX30DRAFT_362084 [Ascodesmis nigricans]|uniref:Sec20 C-terminal domain-containing protein n=1 Tax=Ascodesmis nigricans TaxID=341454 RepID=A0A4S2N4V9_9PEZI|nr:hypothetical protein EX30DRAFT_362084 [Ascodesmis nigricans]
MTVVSYQERLNALQDIHREIQSLITSLPNDLSLAPRIHNLLRSFSISHEALSDDLRAPTHSHLQPKLTKLSEDQRLLTASFRRTLLSTHRAIKEAQFSPGKQSPTGEPSDDGAAQPEAQPSPQQYYQRPRNESASPDDLALSASSDVTVALFRTRLLLSAELEKSAFASATLQESSEALRELSQRYTMFDDVLTRSKELVRDLVNKRKSDGWYYRTAVQILIGTLIWILVRRLIWGPVYLFIGLPVRVVWWILFTSFKLVGLAGRSGGEVRGGGEAGPGVETLTIVDGITTPGSATESGGITPGGQEEGPSGNWEDMSQENWETTTSIYAAEPPASEEAETAASMVETVAKIIGDGETTILRNTMSRRFEYDPSAEAEAEAAAQATEVPLDDLVKDDLVKHDEL